MPFRRSFHTAGSPAAQAALSSLAGWAPSRRSLLSTALVLSSATAAVATAVAFPVLSAASASAPAMAQSSASRVLELVAAFDAATAKMLAADEGEAFNNAADDRSRIIEELLGEPVADIADLNAKLTALLPLFSEADDSETPDILLEIIARDVKALAGGAK